MKKVLSCILILCMLPALCVPAFAAAKTCSCGHDPVIYVHGFGAPLYEFGDEETVQIYPPKDKDFEAQKETIIRAALALLTHRYRKFADLGMEAAKALLGKVACDPEGNVGANTGVRTWGLPSKDVHGKMQNGGADYVFTYDWRLSPIDNAELMHAYIKQVERICGHQKVSLVCHSMGNTLLASYLYLYGNEDFSHMVALAPAWQGVSIMGSLLKGEAKIGDKSKQLDLFLQSLPIITDKRLKTAIRLLGKTGLYPIILWHLQRALNSQFTRVFDECLRDLFINMPGIWAFVPDSYYEDAKAFSLGDDPKYDVLREKIDRYHYEVQNNLVTLLQDAVDNGVQLVILSGYGISSMPLSYAHTTQSDILIDTALTSIGATCAPFGRTLSSGVCLSPDKTVDAGSCAFPDKTWFVHGLMHFSFYDETKDFIRWAVDQSAQPDAGTAEEFPRFLAWDAENGLHSGVK